jgi:hypothetical protein
MGSGAVDVGSIKKKKTTQQKQHVQQERMMDLNTNMGWVGERKCVWVRVVKG